MESRKNNASGSRSSVQTAEIIAEVQQAAADHLNARDADTALGYYTKDATIVSNGYLYPSFQSFAEHVKAFYASLRKIDLAAWEDIDIRVINAGAAIFTAKFRWRSTDTQGDTLNLQGVWSAVFIREKDCWKINMRHESFPPSENIP